MDDDSIPKSSIIGILRSAIDIEKFGIRYYTAVESAIEDKTGKQILNYLIDAERKHQSELEEELDKQRELGAESLKPLPLDNIGEDGKLIIFAEPLNNYESNKISAIDSIKFGIHVEKRSIDFYTTAAKLMSDLNLKERFNKLVKFEQTHLELLKKNLSQLEQDGTWNIEVPEQ